MIKRGGGELCIFLEWIKVTGVRETIVITLTKLLLSKSMIIVKAYFKNITQTKSGSSSIMVHHKVQILH